MSASLRRKGLASVVLLALTGGLLIVATAGAGITQEGANNYIGPGPCPPADAAPGEDWNCQILGPGEDIEFAEQAAPTGGRNIVECPEDTCANITQRGTSPTERPTNTVDCSNTVTGDSTNQICQVNLQQGGNNTINADFTATATRTETLTTTGAIAQVAKQRFITTQDGDNNTLNVKGTIDQSATSTVALNLPIAVTHEQGTLQLSDNDMQATASNVVSYVLNRTQNSRVDTGGFVTQLQDSPEVLAETEPGIGLAEIDLVADSGGTNTITVHGVDAKTQNTTGPQTKQTQGHADGGLLASLDVDSTIENGGFDIDVGAPGSDAGTQDPGLKKVWFQHASVAPDLLADQTQDDGIKIPIISQSPFDVQSNSFCDLQSDEGARIVASQSANGKAKDDWTGRLACNLKAGTKVQNPVVNFQGKSIQADLNCELNADVCPGATVVTPNAELAVRNAGTEEGFSNATSAAAGDTVEYQAVFTNTGSAPAENVILTARVPTGTTFAGCSDCTPAPEGNSVSWSLGDVGGGSDPRVRAFDVTVDAGTPSGSFTGKATGEFGPEGSRGTFESNETTLTFLAPLSHAHLAVRNVSSEEAFTGDESHPTDPVGTEAEPGQTVEYAATFHNEGDGVARNATLSAPTPAGMTCVSGCPEGGTWNLGDVQAGGSTTMTLQAQVNAETPAGPIANTVTGGDNQEEPFVSNVAVVTVVEPPPPPVRTVEIEISGEDRKSGVIPVAILSAHDFDALTVDPASVCFGDAEAPAERDCTEAHGTGHPEDVNGDGRTDLMLHYEAPQTGIDPKDKTACLTGSTFDGQLIEGCGNLPRR